MFETICISLSEAAMGLKPARRFRQAALDQQHEKAAGGADRNHDSPAIDAERRQRHQRGGEEGRDRERRKDKDIGSGHVATARRAWRQLGDVAVIVDQLHADGEPGDEAGEIDRRRVAQEGNRELSDRVDDHRLYKDRAPADPVGDEAEPHGAHEHAEEEGGEEARK